MPGCSLQVSRSPDAFDVFYIVVYRHLARRAARGGSNRFPGIGRDSFARCWLKIKFSAFDNDLAAELGERRPQGNASCLRRNSAAASPANRFSCGLRSSPAPSCTLARSEPTEATLDPDELEGENRLSPKRLLF